MIYGVPEGFDQNKNSDLCHTVMGFALNCPVFKTMASHLYCQAQILSSVRKNRTVPLRYYRCPGTVLQSLMIYHCNGDFAAHCRRLIVNMVISFSQEKIIVKKFCAARWQTLLFLRLLIAASLAHCSI